MNIYLKNRLSEYLLTEKIGRKRLLKYIGNKMWEKGGDDFLKNLSDEGISVIAFDEEEYPKRLKEIPDYPLLLFVKGKKELLSSEMVTVVGTRKITEYGKKVSKNLIDWEYDLTYVSGLARGIDCEIHTNCLNRNSNTIAVVAGGLYEGFPKSNRDVFKNICKKGLIISEFPPGRKIIKGMFPMRNRILAGLSNVTIIVESDIDGGSMITGRLALEYGREVACVPGSIFSNSSKGCNYLISQGARNLYNKEEYKELIRECIQ